MKVEIVPQEQLKRAIQLSEQWTNFPSSVQPEDDVAKECLARADALEHSNILGDNGGNIIDNLRRAGQTLAAYQTEAKFLSEMFLSLSPYHVTAEATSFCPAGKHAYDYIIDWKDKVPEFVRRWLIINTLPAIEQNVLKGIRQGGGYNPTVFAKLDGKVVKLMMASRLGDIGVAYNLNRETGYDKRVYLEELSDFSETPF
jgi:hypothetical protein